MRPRQLTALLVVCGTLPRALASAQPADLTGAESPASEAEANGLEVWLLGADDEWTARARGQLSDLSARLRVDPRPLPADFEHQLEAAKGVARDGVVGWLWPNGRDPAQGVAPLGGAYFCAWFPRNGRLYTRRVGPPLAESDPAEWSATLEFAALALRTSVRAVLAGETLGARPATVIAPAPSPLVTTQPAPQPARGERWTLGASLAFTLDGATETGLFSLGPVAGGRMGHYTWTAGGEVGLSDQVPHQLAEVRLRRHAALVGVGRVLGVSRGLTLTPELQLGAAWFRRDTESSTPQLLPAEAHTSPSPFLGVAWRANLELAPPLRLGLELAGHWVPGAPVLRLSGSEETQVGRVWWIQPRLRSLITAAW